LAIKTVLIADDVAFVRTTLSKILTKAGYQVVAEAADGHQAVSLFEKHRPDVITMDIVMPVMSGIEAIRKIVENNPDVKIVIISAMIQESLMMEAINAGAHDYLPKPFTAEDVVKTLDRLTGGSGEKSRSTQGSRRA
jgi:two-component system chemotaxis response regulator CheY